MKQNPLEQAVEKAKKNKLQQLKEEFEQEKKKETHRIVKLVIQSCCGCGCEDINIKRIVPYDSPLQDGDEVTKFEKGDTEWE